MSQGHMEVVQPSAGCIGLIAHSECDAKLLARLRDALTAGDPAVRLTLLLELLERHEGEQDVA